MYNIQKIGKPKWKLQYYALNEDSEKIIEIYLSYMCYVCLYNKLNDEKLIDIIWKKTHLSNTSKTSSAKFKMIWRNFHLGFIRFSETTQCKLYGTQKIQP